MQCPNCGRTVRSKNQCAHCGHVFNKGEIKEASQDVANDDIYEETNSRNSGGGVGRILWGIIKLVLAVAIVFLAFLFGPRIINNVVEYFQPADTAVVENMPADNQTPEGNGDGGDGTPQVPETTETTEETASVEEDTAADTAGGDDVSEEEVESSEEIEEDESDDGQINLANYDVNLDEYPMINMEIEFEETLDTVTSDTFAFSVETNGDSVDLDGGYSLVKEGQVLSLSFNDPAISVLSTEPTEQTLNIQSDVLNIDESISYELPSSTMDSDLADTFNSTITDNLAALGSVSAVLYSPNADVPFVYDDQTDEADALISWFVLAHTYQSVNDGLIALDDVITVNSDLVAANDETSVAASGEGTEYTIQDLIIEAIHNQSASAMNHLIQANGGPNEFNLWLNESNYFATRITQLLSVTESGEIEGAVTNAQDISYLLNLLVNNELVTEELDTAFKELLLDSPLTEKYPYEQLTIVQSRYEVATGDNNPNQQYYSGILETEDDYYIVVILQKNFDSAAETVPTISNSINSLVTYMETGEEAAEPEPESEEIVEVPVEETPSQVSVVEEEVPMDFDTGQVNNEWDDTMTSETGITYGPDSDGDGFRDTYLNEAGEFVPIEWYQEADELWYFRPAQ